VRIFRAIDKNRTGIASGASVTSFTAPCLELISTLPSVGCAITSIAWLPPPSSSTGLEGSVLYAGVADGTIRKFTVASSAQNARATGSAPRAMSTGIVLATSDDNTGTNNSTNQSSFTGLQWKANVRLTVENLGRRVATKIWSLQALDDGTLISGDSMGNVQFWDGNAGTLLQSFQHNPNNADVLDLVVNLDQNKVMASGVDSRVVCFQLNPEAFGSTNRWILSLQQRSHTHDVNSLTMVYMTDPTGCAGSNTKPSSSGYKELLCSGGVDTKVSSYFVSNMRKHRPKLAYKYPSSAPVALSKRQRIMSIMRPDQVDFYQLGDKRPVPSSRGGKGVALDEERSHLGSVRISTNYNLASFDLNDDGTLLAVSNAAGLHLFSLDFVETYEDGRDDEEIISRKIVKPSKIDIPLAMNVSCSSLKFSKSDPNLLICANCNGAINVIKVVSGSEDQDCSVSLEHTFNPDVTSSNSSNNYPITHLDVSPDGRWLAAGRNTIGKGLNVFALSPMFKHWWTLPCTEAPLSSMRWLGGGSVDPALAVALNNGVFYLFDVEQRCLSDWSQDLGFPANPNLPKELSQCQDCPDRLAFNPATPSKFLMGGQTWFCSIDLAAPVPKRSIPHPLHHFRAKTWGNTSQRQRSRSNSAIEDSLSPDKTRPNGEDEKSQLDSSNNFTICLRYSGMIFLDFLDENELVVVEQPWLGIVNQLPDALERQRYGS
jgi:U3 small nucleolar RNA-associated protein 4